MNLSKIKGFLKQNAMLFRMLISFVIICAVLLSALSVFLYTEYSEGSIEDYYNASVDMLNQTYMTADAQLIAVYNYFFRMYMKDKLVFDALYAKSFDAEGMFDISRKLNDYVQSNPLVESVYIYNRNAGTVFSSKTSAQDTGSFFDHEIVEYLNKEKSFAYPIFIPRKVTYKIYEKTEDMKFLTIVFAEPVKNSGLDAALVVNISQEYFQQILSWNPKVNFGEKFIVNKSGTVILHPDKFTFGKDISAEGYFSTIRLENKDKGYFTTDINGRKYLVSYCKSNNILGWYFISTVEYDKLISRIGELRSYVFLITGIFIFISVIISLLFTRNLYKPLHNLLRNIKSRGMSPKETTMDEYGMLNQTFETLSANVSDLKVLLNTYKPAKKKEFLEKLLLGELQHHDYMNKESVKLNIDLDSNYYLVCVLKIDSFKELSSNYSLKDIALLRFAVSNIAIEILQDCFKIEAIDSSKDFISLVFSIKENDGIIGDIKESLKKIQHSSKNYLSLSVTASIGSIVNSIEDIHISYINALAASNHRVVAGKGSIIDYEDIPKVSGYNYEYPFDGEKKVLDCLKLEDFSGVSESLDRFIENISKYSYDEIMLSLTQLAMVIVKTASGVFNIPNEKLGLKYQNVHNQITECDTVEEVKDWFVKLCGSIISALEEKKDKKKEQLIERVVKHINDNYQNPDITIDELAEKVDLSANHLRLIFKDYVGKSLSSYISEVRFQQAQRLLRETDYPAKKIAEMVGYSNSSYFYISFKKFTGSSPEQYRKDSLTNTKET